MLGLKLRRATLGVAAIVLLVPACGRLGVPGQQADDGPDTQAQITSTEITSSEITDDQTANGETTAVDKAGIEQAETGPASTMVVDVAPPGESSEVPDEPAPEDPQEAPLAPERSADATEQWRIDLAASGLQLPGGGTDVFPGRRLVANYGSPATAALGVLGETSVDANLAQLTSLAEQYKTSAPSGAESLPIVPSLEIIVSVATVEATPNEDYSKYLAKYRVRQWVEAATEAGAFVILDLQPGRTDFVTQAKWFEEFLRLPNVGLALDPEWRIGPNEVHLRRIGSVEAAEVNAVIDYLVGLVHEEALPQKILVLHQFKRSMLPDRELIKTPPELAVVVHADGQGPLGSKYGTWDDLVTQPTGPDQNLWWGWKNFYDEDDPVATPTQVNQVEPLPVLITYQ